jgi:hypothetical protein
MTQKSSTRTTRIKGELDKKYEEYRDENDMTDSEALRSLVRAGLDAETGADGGDQGPTQSRSTSSRIVRGIKHVAGAFFDSMVVLITGVFAYSVYLDDGPVPTVLLLLAIGAVIWVVSTVVNRIDTRADKIDGSFGDAVRSIIRRESPNSNGDTA